MYKLLTSLLMGCLLISLIAFKPYAKINRQLGIAADTMAVDSSANADTLFIEESAAVVLGQSVTDTLAEKVSQDKKQRDYWAEQNKLLGDELSSLKEKVRHKQQAIQEEKQALLSLDKISELLVTQKTAPKGSRPREDIDARTGLLKEGNNHP